MENLEILMLWVNFYETFVYKTVEHVVMGREMIYTLLFFKNISIIRTSEPRSTFRGSYKKQCYFLYFLLFLMN